MTDWNRNALRLVPERNIEFASTRTVEDILASLPTDFVHSSEADAKGLGARMAEYLRECLQRSRHDEFERRIIHKYLVHWGSDRRLCELVFQILTPERFRQERAIFEEPLEAADFEQLWASFIATNCWELAYPPQANTR